MRTSPSTGTTIQRKAAKSLHTERNRLVPTLVVYLAASFIHFAHNAEFLGNYPNLPSWITPSGIYLSWVGLAAIGVSGLILYLRNRHAVGLLLVGVYAAFGFDGLIHYSRASFAEHSVAINLSIWFEVVAAGALMVVVVTSAIRRCLAGQAI